MSRTAQSGREAGFTLVEVLVAFFIAALTLTMALRVLGEGAGWARRGPAAALRLEETASLLDGLLAEPRLQPGERDGRFTDGRAWRVEVSDVTKAVAPGAAGRLLRIAVFDGAAGAPLVTTLAVASRSAP